MKLTFRSVLASLALTGVSLGLSACSGDDLTNPAEEPDLARPRLGTAASGRDDLRQQLTRMLDDVNGRLALSEADVRAALISTIGMEEQGITVLWKDVGNKHLGVDFVPNDPRRSVAGGGWSTNPNNILFAIDTGDGATLNGVSSAVTTHEIRDGFATWERVACSDLGLTEVSAGGDLGLFAFLISGGAVGGPDVVADIQHAGWLELEAGGTTIAFTVPFGFTDANGNFTDIDGNGEIDYAFAEIYYDAFCQGCAVPAPWIWEVDDGVNNPAGPDIDIETVALHESGHGLSQAHFGKGFLTNSNGKLHLAQNAVLAASYVGPHTSLAGPDKGGHCSLWASWPHK